MSALIDRWMLFWQDQFRGLEFQGLDDHSIDEIIKAQSADRLPESFEAYLRVAGQACGRLWVGSDSHYPRILTLKQSALSLAVETQVEIPALNDAVVFLMHQGYVFLYVGTTGEDPPVMQFHESFAEPTQVADSFSGFVVKSVKDLGKQ